MKLGLKKIIPNRIGLKREAHNFVRMGLKAADIVSASAPVIALAGPEAVPVASALEAGGMAGKAIFSLASKIV
jgi:hypothetical protein